MPFLRHEFIFAKQVPTQTGIKTSRRI